MKKPACASKQDVLKLATFIKLISALKYVTVL